MRVAFCLYGLTGGIGAGAGRGAALHPAVAHFYYSRVLHNFAGFDVFCHTYTGSRTAELTDTYKPKLLEVTDNIHLTDTPAQYSAKYDHYLPAIRKKPDAAAFLAHLARMQGSKWYSMQRAVHLKARYEQEQGFRYDYVFLTRYDMLFYPRLDVTLLDRTKVYGAKRTSAHHTEFALYDDDTVRESARTVQDYFYISNSTNADLIGAFFDHRFAYSVRPSFAIYDYLADHGVGVETPFNLGRDVLVARFILNTFDDLRTPVPWA